MDYPDEIGVFPENLSTEATPEDLRELLSCEIFDGQRILSIADVEVVA